MQHKLSLNRRAFQNLSFNDQVLFESFGVGSVSKASETHIHRAIEAHAIAQPMAVAAKHLEDAISYQELNQQANRLAALLESKGVRAGDNVALFLERSLPMLVGILASLKVGAAYVPQHVGVAPLEQLRHILDFTQAKVVLTLSHLKDFIPASKDLILISIDDLMKQPLPEDVFNIAYEPRVPVSYSNNCFILFTSGTTGQPNGVQVSHSNLCNILLTQPGDLGMKPGLKVSQILSIAFDMAAWEILGCLSHGATLLIRGKNIEETVKQADIVIATPTILSKLNSQECKNVKIVAVAGESCPRALADTWATNASFYNSCGPTETTIVNTMQLHSALSEKLTIGRPTPNNTVYILDENLMPCPIGQVGEMWAGGKCVSNGYLNNSQLTTERYLPDPFLGEDRLMFRTRDLGRWTTEGELEHFGRTDDQVKIRGFRVELDSVSAILETVVRCNRAVTLKLNDQNLVAFVTPRNVDIHEAKDAVSAKLPYYCTPALVVALDDLPLTDNGKIDKRALTIIAVRMQEQKVPEQNVPDRKLTWPLSKQKDFGSVTL